MRSQPAPAARRGDLICVALEAALLVAAVVVGTVLTRRGVQLHVDAAPVYGRWGPHVGWGTPVAIGLAGAVVWWGPAWAARLSWPRLLVAGYCAALTWTLSLATVDGWSAGIATRLTRQGEYLQEVPKIGSIAAMLAGFTDGILDFGPRSWATHVSGHPPGALLVFVWLDRIGLGGGAAAGLACIVAGATLAVTIPVTVRALGDESAARAVLPYLVLFPGAVWVGASADGIFAAVLAAGLALLAARAWWPAPLGGAVLGFALYLSYGLVVAGLLALAVLALRDRYRIRAALLATAGAGAVVVAFTAAGFWWFDGYRLVVQRYYQGWAADRPYGYWVWANLACLLLATGPVLVPALRRTFRPAGAETAHAAAQVTRWLPLAAAVAVLAADLSGLSKAEVERIWLPFAGWLLVATARLPAADRRWWLAAQAATALAVNHLLWTNW